jgi:hypothetical protein
MGGGEGGGEEEKEKGEEEVVWADTRSWGHGWDGVYTLRVRNDSVRHVDSATRPMPLNSNLLKPIQKVTRQVMKFFAH